MTPLPKRSPPVRPCSSVMARLWMQSKPQSKCSRTIRFSMPGRGAAFAADGTHEMDAALMDGATLAAGSVAAVHSTRNPIALARAVMDHTQYVMMVGAGADAFARAQGLEQEPPAYFFTEMRWQEFTAVMKASGRAAPDRPVDVTPAVKAISGSSSGPNIFLHRFGTVGAVARDSEGHLAAATSTGGMQGKLPGRVGDSPLIGAGTYASDHSCAVSGTGVGEYFIRLTLAREVCTLVEEGLTPAAGRRPPDSLRIAGTQGWRRRRDCARANGRASLELEHLGHVSRARRSWSRRGDLRQITALRHLGGFGDFQSHSNNARKRRTRAVACREVLSIAIARENDKSGLLRYL